MDLRAELAAIESELCSVKGSMEWAYANGDGCSMGPKHPNERAILDWVDALEERRGHILAIVQEHGL